MGLEGPRGVHWYRTGSTTPEFPPEGICLTCLQGSSHCEDSSVILGDVTASLPPQLVSFFWYQSDLCHNFKTVKHKCWLHPAKQSFACLQTIMYPEPLPNTVMSTLLSWSEVYKSMTSHACSLHALYLSGNVMPTAHMNGFIPACTFLIAERILLFKQYLHLFLWAEQISHYIQNCVFKHILPFMPI